MQKHKESLRAAGYVGGYIISCALSTASAQSATVIDLGVLPGGSYASARAINGTGTAAGVAQDGTSGNVAVTWAGGGISRLSGCCAGGQATPLTINANREVVAWENGGYATNGIYWDATGTFTVLPTLSNGLANRVHAYDINATGLIVGDSQDSTTNVHCVVWNRATFSQDLGFLGQADPTYKNFCSARGVNDQGDIVGTGLVGTTRRAFVWRAGSFTDLGPGEALDINNNGLIVGYDPGLIPVLWRNGVKENLPALSGQPPAYGHTVTDINNLGDVVGFAPALDNSGDTAVLWRAGKAINLGRAGAGTTSRAYGINDNGQIVGEGPITASGPMHALLWTVSGSTTPPTTNAAPVATLSATTATSIRRGGSVTFQAAFTDPDNGPWTYTLAWGDGTSSTGSLAAPQSLTQSHAFTRTGTFSVSFTAKDAKGSAGTSPTVKVTVR